MKKSWYIKLLLTAGLSVIVESSCLGNEEYSITAQKISSKPNFIFIAVDDLNIYNTVSGDHSTSFLKKIYPDQQQRSDIIKKLTPNLKKIANKSCIKHKNMINKT